MRAPALLVLALLPLGACAETHRLRDVVGQGRALLRDSSANQVADPEWQARRATYLRNAAAVAPEESNGR